MLAYFVGPILASADGPPDPDEQEAAEMEATRYPASVALYDAFTRPSGQRTGRPTIITIRTTEPQTGGR